MNNIQKEIATAVAKVAEAMNIIGKVAEANGMRISIGERKKDPLEELAEMVAEETGKDTACIYEILATAVEILEEEDVDEDD